MKREIPPIKKLEKVNEKAFSAILLAICLCFYLFFAFYDGAVICVGDRFKVCVNSKN